MKKLIGMLAIGFGMSVVAQSPEIKYEEYDLPNGLHVILHEDHSTPIVAVSVMYHVGSKNEDTARTGFAHFFEHLLFEGSENIKRGEFFKYIENAGGQNNANTTKDRTFYYEVLPSNQLDLGLWLESERMLHAVINDEGIETQREVVKEERRLRYDNRPYGTWMEEVFKRAYKVHPYRWSVIGSLEHLNAAQKQEFIDFYHKFYVPNNAILSVAGDFDSKEIKKKIKAYFGEIPKGKEVPKVTIVEPPLNGEVRDTVYDNIQLPAVIEAYRVPEKGAKDFYAVEMLNLLLSSGESSRLDKRLVQDEEKALYIGSFAFDTEHPGLSMIFAIANGDTKPDELEKGINEEIERVKNELITDKEYQKLRNTIESDFIYNFNSMIGIAENLANYEMYLGDANLINTELERYMAVTKEDIQRVAKKYFDKDNRVVLYYLPKEDKK